MLLEATGITKEFGDNILFKDVSFKIEPNDKIGLIGLNGSGKSTLFNLLCGDLDCDTGRITRKSGLKIGQLHQHACSNSDKTTFQEALSVFDSLMTIEQQLYQVNKTLETSYSEDLLNRQQQLQESYEAMGGLTFRSRTIAALTCLGFDEKQQQLKVSQLSGGQKSKVELCKLLLSAPDLLLLDEPTNHLDIDSIEWLDNYISSYRGAIVIISHDRYFLDRSVTKILEISHKKVFCYNGNYSKYSSLKAERSEAIQKNYENTMREINRIEEMIAQQKTFSMERNYRTIDTKQKQIDRLLRDIEKPESEEDKLRISFTPKSDCGNEVLNAENLTAEYDGRLLYKNASLTVRRNERIFLIGPNGCGKTTLLKQLLNDKLNVKTGSRVSLGYFDQHGGDLNFQKSPFEQLRSDNPLLTDTQIRNALAAVLIKGDAVFKKIIDLSGGERAKVALCRLSLRKDNVMLLDEPTNHLDLDSRECLEDALLKYDGTLIIVSHDRYFINRLASSVIRFKNATLETIQGNYDKYLELKTAEQCSEQDSPKLNTMSSNKKQYLMKKAQVFKASFSLSLFSSRCFKSSSVAFLITGLSG